MRAHSLQRGLIKALTDELNCQCGDLLFHCELRSLRRDALLKKCSDALLALSDFFKEHEGKIIELEDEVWLQDFAVLFDVTSKLNKLNLQ